MSRPDASSQDPLEPAPPPELRGLNTLVTLSVCVVAVAALDVAREVLIPITLAVLLSFVVAPLVSLLKRLRLPRVAAVLLAVLISLGVILLAGALIGAQIAQLADEVPRYQHTIERKVETVRAMTVGRLSGIMRGVGRQLEQTVAPATPPPAPSSGAPSPAGASAPPPPQAPIAVEVHQPDPTPLELAERVLTPFVGPLSTTAIVFIVAIFILLQREDLRDRLIRLFGSGDLHRTTVALNDAAARLSRYFLTQLAINVAFGVVIGIGLLAIGVPSPVLWGILAALLRFVPYVGAPLAALSPLALAAAVDPGWTTVLWTGGLFLASELLTGQVIEPMLYGHSTGLSPVSVVVAATFWTWLWGPIGLILSTPLTLCLVVLGRHVQRLEFLDVLLGNRPALTPVESFYQRMLAGDSDEAYEQAEALLRERSLSGYYDDVAIKGLQLAAADLLSGALTDRQLARIRNTFDLLVADLDSHEDAEPESKPSAERSGDLAPTEADPEPPRATPAAHAPAHVDLSPAWQGDGSVLCVAGRGPLDHAAAIMLAQLLAKHGLGARAVQHVDVTPGRLRDFDLTQAAMICVCCLDIVGTPSHVRYLVRRLRLRRRDIPILAGFWSAGDAILADAQQQAMMGADHYVSSLREAVELSVAAAISAAPESAPLELDVEPAS